MNTHLRITCPNCRRGLKARPEHLNQRVVCNRCRHAFVARAEDGEDLFSPSRLPAAAQRPEESASVVASASLAGGVGLSLPARPPAAAADPDKRVARPAPGLTADELRREIASLHARLEPLSARAREADRLEGSLKEAAADLERLRLTVKILQADLFTRAAELQRLEAGQAAIDSEFALFRGTIAELERSLAEAGARHARELEEERAGRQRERQALSDRAEQLATELEALREERERQQAEAARLRAEIERQRLRREAEIQAQREDLAARRHALAQRLQSRTASPTEADAG